MIQLNDFAIIIIIDMTMLLNDMSLSLYWIPLYLLAVSFIDE